MYAPKFRSELSEFERFNESQHRRIDAAFDVIRKNVAKEFIAARSACAHNGQELTYRADLRTLAYAQVLHSAARYAHHCGASSYDPNISNLLGNLARGVL